MAAAAAAATIPPPPPAQQQQILPPGATTEDLRVRLRVSLMARSLNISQEFINRVTIAHLKTAIHALQLTLNGNPIITVAKLETLTRSQINREISKANAAGAVAVKTEQASDPDLAVYDP